MTATALRAPSILPILSVNFVGTLGFSIVLPFLVFLVTRLGGNALVYGVMGATYSLFQMIGAPILGRWSDRFGRRRILLLSQLGTLTSWGIFLIALALPVTPLLDVDSERLGAFTITTPLLVLFLARALDGVTGGNVSVANAYLADVTPEEERAANFGRMAVSSNLGFILGPAIAGVLGATAFGEVVPVFAAFCISAVASLLILVALRDVPRCQLEVNPEEPTVRRVLGQEQKECYEMEAGAELSALEVLRLPSVAWLLALYFLVFLAFNFFYIAFPVYAATDLAWTLAETGAFFSVLGLLMVLVQGPVLAWASRRWSERTLVIGGSLLLALSFPFFAGRTVPGIYTGTALLALGNGTMWPSLLAIISRSTDRDTQGAVQGLASSVGALASILGLLAGGLLFAWLGRTIFLVSAAVTGLVFFLAIPLPAPRPADREASR